MRGECKTPGGKLVVVDLKTQGGVISAARISGDFFVYPENTAAAVLARMTEALVRMSVAASQEDLCQRLEDVLPWDVELLGTSTRAVALAVRRALGDVDAPLTLLPEDEIAGRLSDEAVRQRTKSWRGLPWRILPETPLAAPLNVALDEVLTQTVSAAKRPTLRFWRWAEQAVILGRCQSVRNEVDHEAATARGVRIVRRMTGGGAMFLQPHGAITYSLYLPETLLAGVPLRQSYQVCEAWVIDGLRQLGVDANHVPINDIACSMGKIGGAAQARRAGVVLHHTTIAYDMDPGDMVRVLRIGREKLADKPAVTSAAKRVSPLVRQTGLPREAIVTALLGTFRERFGGTVEALTPDELAVGEALAVSKYEHPAWTFEIE